MTEQITPWLDKLNSMESADEVAKFFEEEGVTGHPKAASSCAISSFLKTKTGKRVSTTPAYVSTYESNTHTRETEVPLGPVLREFVKNFDERKYPALLRVPARFEG